MDYYYFYLLLLEAGGLATDSSPNSVFHQFGGNQPFRLNFSLTLLVMQVTSKHRGGAQVQVLCKYPYFVSSRSVLFVVLYGIE